MRRWRPSTGTIDCRSGCQEPTRPAIRYADLNLYDPDTPAKRDRLRQTLDQSNYIILASRRLADSIPRLPERYPMATAYYRWLESGQLGFERVARFQVQPRIGPVAIDDSRAQEDFTVYDHPVVDVWQKRPDYSSANVQQLLGSVPLDRVVNVRPIDGGKGALLQTATEQASQAEAGTWSELFDRDSLANRLPLLVWLLVAELIAFASLPLLWRWLRFLPDRGFGASQDPRAGLGRVRLVARRQPAAHALRSPLDSALVTRA